MNYKSFIIKDSVLFKMSLLFFSSDRMYLYTKALALPVN